MSNTFRIAKALTAMSALVFVVTITSCLPILRSSNGLRKGQFQVSYNAPLAGDIRVGLTDNIEYRYSIIGESFESDFMYHLHRSFDYSVTAGIIWGPDWDNEANKYPYLPLFTDREKVAAAIAIGMSKAYGERYNPYIAYSYSERTTYGHDAHSFITLGVEIAVAKRDKYPVNLVLTPEVMFIPGSTGGDFDTYVYGSLGIGLNFDTKRLIKSTSGD